MGKRAHDRDKTVVYSIHYLSWQVYFKNTKVHTAHVDQNTNKKNENF